MNLENKYIEIDDKNVKRVIHFLYNNGYYWLNIKTKFRYKEIEVNNHLKKYFSEHLYIKKIYIEVNKCSMMFHIETPLNAKIKFDINFLLREEKLKRILQ